MDKYHVPGNEVVLDLGNHEYAMFAHLIPGAIKVRVGQKVVPGQVVGRVGNSGNSSEPHLHFQLSDSYRLSEAQSLPAPFAHVLVNGERKELYEPVDGAHVSATEPDSKGR